MYCSSVPETASAQDMVFPVVKLAPLSGNSTPVSQVIAVPESVFLLKTLSDGRVSA